jgi:hypothetical protein
MAGLTYVVGSRATVSGKQFLKVTATFDDSYPTGGESITPSDLGLYAIEFVLPMGSTQVTYDDETKKLKVFSVSGDATGFELDDLTVDVAATALASTAITEGAAALADGTVVADEVVDLTVTLGAFTVTSGTVTVGAAAVADGAISGTLDLSTAEAGNGTDQSSVSAVLFIIGY